MRFIGREKELEALERLERKKTSSLAVVWGRRRIGKSTLVEEFLKGKNSWSFSGLPPQTQTTSQDEIDYFITQMARNVGMPELKTSDWSEVFWHLSNQAQRQTSLIIFLDEISWMLRHEVAWKSCLHNETMLAVA
jgi:hypothetical protein